MGRPAICLLFQVNSAGGERINSKRVRIPTLRYLIKEFPKSHVTLMYNHNRLLDLRLEDKNWKMTYWIPILWLQIPQLSPGSWLMMIFDIIGFYRDMWVMWVCSLGVLIIIPLDQTVKGWQSQNDCMTMNGSIPSLRVIFLIFERIL